MKSLTAARKAFKEVINAQVTEQIELGTIGVQVFGISESEYEVITEAGKNDRGHYYIKNREGKTFGIKNLEAVDFESITDRYEAVMTEAADAAEEFAQTGRVMVESSTHRHGYTCTHFQFVEACDKLADINDNNGKYEDLGVVASCASLDYNGDGIAIITESAKKGVYYVIYKTYTRENNGGFWDGEKFGTESHARHFNTQGEAVDEGNMIGGRLSVLQRYDLIATMTTTEPTEGEQTTDTPEEPTEGTETAHHFDALPTVENSPLIDKIRRACSELAKVAKKTGAKVIAFLACFIAFAVALGVWYCSVVYGLNPLMDVLENLCGGLSCWVRVILGVFALFTVIIDLITFAIMNTMAALDRLHAFDGFGGLNGYHGDRAPFFRPCSVLGKLYHSIKNDL